MFRRRLLSAAFTLSLLVGLAPGLQGAAAQNDPARTINLQLIVDSSGSMAAPTDTGIARMESAKTVLNQVISSLPDTDGVNVGFRVYGQGGDNSESGRAESCVSSDLVVPMDGVDVPALNDEVDALQPVGWTPLAYALEQARDDFKDEAGDDVVNAIVMVTDGLETCDGDPVGVAGALRTSDLGIVTNVIGFGTTAEEQDVLSGIAAEGGGELYSSSNAGQLISAVFDILENLDVVAETGSGETRDSPLGVGRTGEVGDYEVTVLSVTPDATDIVAAENQFNDPPGTGDQFFIARVSITYLGSATGNPGVDLNFQSVGNSSASYTTYTNYCGVIPDAPFLTVTELFEGGSAEFNVCWAIDGGDADSLVMYVESSFDYNGDPVWFSLGNPIETVVTAGATPVAEESDEPEPTPTQQPGEDAGETNGDTSRNDPLPVDETIEVGDYEVTVLSVIPDATDVVAAENQFNEPPAPGNQFFIARVSITYVGSATGNPSVDLNFQSVGDSSASYTTFTDYCGVIPDAPFLTVTELFEGGSAEFNVCWAIDSDDAESLVMYVDSSFDYNAEPVWFSLDD